MYSRYAGYRPFDPMSNRLSLNSGGGAVPPPGAMPEPPPPPPPDPPSEPAEQTVAQAFPPAAAAVTPAQRNFLESLLGGGQTRSRRGGSGGGLNLGSLGSLGGIADILRSGGGGITKLLKSFSIDWDAGDILMALILLFMSLEGDDDELLILLGLILVMGL
ncbi:MAG: hypothetical protein FWG72_05765 [Oscillospiraceae bacterium]|nr:hypothetical protein [Oscillospiraceae bacterium]